MSFLRLLLLAGCAFDTDFAEMEKKVLGKVGDLFSQPPTLQELSVMAIRQSIGSRQLWTKIDSLPIPRSVKDMIQLDVQPGQRWSSLRHLLTRPTLMG